MDYAAPTPCDNMGVRRIAGTGVKVMRVKAAAFVLVIGLSVALFMALHRDNRADAAAGDCYAAAQGPSTPTICQ